MEITRRNFIQLLAGGVAGIHVTPVPWKLMDDIAIWTQNWPWVPVPERGPFSHDTSVCSLCPGGCGIEVRKAGNRAVKIEGRSDFPVNSGGVCALGAGGLQLLYDETIRFTSPMKLVGPRGSGQFEPISWDEALGILAERIKALRNENRPEALAAVNGNRPGTATEGLVQRLLQAVGSPNCYSVPSIQNTYTTANLLMQGNSGPMAYDIENSDFVLSFGCALIEGWGAPGRIIEAWGHWRNGSGVKAPRIVQVESRASNTASKSDQWIAARPGTEAALALGLAYVLISEDLVDSSFLSNHTHGYGDWIDRGGRPRTGFRTMVLQSYAPDKVAEITGVKADRIIALAREFGKARAPLALYGKGKGNLDGSLLECMAVQGLNALKGSINRPGGVITQKGLPVSPWPELKADPVAARGVSRGRIGIEEGVVQFGEPSVETMIKAVLEYSGESPVDTLLIFGANPAFTLNDAGAFEKAVNRIPFTVSFSPYRDETSVLADLILPDHTALEKREDIVWPTGLQYPFLGLSKAVVQPLYDTRHMGDSVIALARKVGGQVAESFPWRSFEDALKARLNGLAEARGLTEWGGSKPVWETFAEGGTVSPDYDSFNDMWRKLDSGGFWYNPSHDFHDRSAGFATPSGKFEFLSGRLEQGVRDAAAGGETRSVLERLGVKVDGDDAYMPHYEPVLSAKPEGDSLVLVPYEIFNHSTDWLPNPPFLTKTLFDTQLRNDELVADINPETAAKLRLKEGDRVLIQSESGEAKVLLHLFEGAMPGHIYMPLGFGHTAYGVYQKDKGVNAAKLVAGKKDPLTGRTLWWTTSVRVRKA